MPVLKESTAARRKRPGKTKGPADGVIIVLDAQGRILSVRPPRGLSLLSHRGAPKQQLLADILPPAAARSYRKALKGALKSGKQQTIGFVVRDGGGKRKLVLSLTPHPSEGILFADLKAAPEVPVRPKRAATDLERARDILENLTDAVMIVNKEMRLVLVNNEACRSLGYTQEELLNLHVWDFEVGIGAEGRRALVPRVVAGETVTVRGLHRRKDGSVFPVESGLSMAVIGGEKVVMICARDITAQVSLEREAAESVERYQILSRNELVGFSIIEDGVITYCNERYARIFGWRPEEMAGKMKLEDLILPEDLELFRKNYRLRMSGKQKFMNYRIRCRHRNGDTVHVEVFGSSMEKGGKRLLHGTVLDVTDQVRDQEQLLFRDKALKTSKRGVAIADTDGILTYVNEAFLGMWGYRNAKEVVGRPSVDFWSNPDQAAEVVHDLYSQEFVSGELEAVRKDGTLFVARLSSNLVRDDEGKPIGMLAWFADVTDEMKVHEALRVSEAEKTAILGAMSELVAYQDLEMNVLWANRAAEESVGAAPGALVGRKCYEIWHGRSVRCDVCPIARAKRSGKAEQDEVHTPDGRVWIITGYPIKDGAGRVTSLIEVTRNVTEEVRAKEALRESEERFRTIFRASPDGMMIHDIDTGKVIDVSDSFGAFTGFSREESIGRTVMDLGLEQDPGQRRRLMDMLLPGGEVRNVEIRFRRKDGTLRTGLFSGRIVPIDGVQRLLATVRDITAFKDAEIALRESEERFRAAFEMSPDAFLILDARSRSIIDVNHGFVAMSGFAKKEAVERTTLDLGLWKDARARDAMYAEFAKKGRVDNMEADFQVKDGSVRKGMVYMIPITLQGKQHLLAIVHDISKVKETENRLRSLLEEKEVLLKEVHHRVKNNLHVVSGLLNLQAHHVSEPEVRNIFRESQNRVITMALIHEELYRAKDLAHLDFAQYLRNLAENLLVSYGVNPERIALRLDLQNVRMVMDTAIPVGLVVNELLSNALKHAFPGGRKGQVSISFREHGSSEYCIKVEDDGVGLPAGLDVRNTKSLGLRIVTMICDQLGGSLSVGGEEGTAFGLVFREYREAGTSLH